MANEIGYSTGAPCLPRIPVDSGGGDITDAAAHALKVTPVGAGAFVQGSRTANAGSRAALAAATACKGVLVTAKPGNTGWVYVGDGNVSSTAFVKRLGPDSSIWVPCDNLNDIYIDVSVSGEGVDFGYVA